MLTGVLEVPPLKNRDNRATGEVFVNVPVLQYYPNFTPYISLSQISFIFYT